MKICMLVRNDMTRDSRVRREAGALAQMGHQVIVYAVESSQTQSQEEIDGFLIKRIAPYHARLSNSASSIAWTMAARAYSALRKIKSFVLRRKLAAPSLPTKSILEDLQRRWIFRPAIWLLDPHYCQKTISACIAERADVYHAHDLNTLHMAYRAAKGNGAKLIYDTHELYLERNPDFADYNKLFNLRLRQRERRLIQKADAVITVNESIADELARKYSIERPAILMNIPPRQKILDKTLLRKRVRDELNLTLHPEMKILLYLGGITANHGLEQVLLSLHHLRKAVFVVMGYGYRGSYPQELAAMAKREGLDGRFFVLSPVSSEEVPCYASGADVGVVPIQNICLSYYYCTPNKLFECIAAQIPVAVSDLPELRGFVERFEIGEVFNEREPKEIARAVHKVLGDEEHYAALKRNLKVAAEKLNWEIEAEKLRKIYATLETSPHANVV
ncbi:glycosyltransferase [Candidatus Acetothermia bacterium]|nr:glycosyltransferase [Candidatus Acetothermia bacterium]